MSPAEVEKLVDDLLEECVPGYVRPERRQKKAPKLVTTRDGFEAPTPK